MNIEPVILEGRHIRLEPLSLAHQAQLYEVGHDDSIWRWNPQFVIRTPEDMRVYIEAALQQQADGESLPFATIEKISGRAVGSTRYANIDAINRRLEIG